MNESFVAPQEKGAAGVSRREFLRMAGVTAVAATAAGAGAAAITRQTATPVSLPVATPLPPLPAAAGGSEALAHLAAAQAENQQLQAALAAAQQRLDAQSHTTTELAQLRAALDTANQRVSVLVGLLALYEQMDEMDAQAVWQAGLTAVSRSLSALLDEIPWLEEGIATGRSALQKVEAHIPLLQNGRSWLADHHASLRRSYEGVKRLLETAVQATGPFLDMLNAWFQEMRKWLPFGLGARAGEVMQSLADLLGEIPFTLSGLDTNVAQPLAVWLDGAEGETPLKREVIRPLQTQVLDKADSVAGKAKQVEVVYAQSLVPQVETAVANQQALRSLIAAYRREHQI